MKCTLAFILASLAVITGKRLRQNPQSESASNETDSTSFEDRDWIVGPFQFDTRGALRRSFALLAASTDPSRNLICSPISALLPLGKLVLGTERGRSRDELLNAIGYSKNKVKKRLRSLINKLKFLPGVTLSISSALYVSKKTRLLGKYHSDTVSVFPTAVQKIDFEKPTEAASVINKMVYDGTNGKIQKIVEPGDISPSTSLILVNAIYFAGRWKDPFKNVRLGDFLTPTGLKKVPMMWRHGEYNYHMSDSLDAQIIELPYEGDKASFVIVLPRSRKGLPLLLSQLKVAPSLLNTAISKMKERNVFLTMPKFKIETELNLNVLYERLGIKRIFLHDQSGLTRITNEKELWLSKATQKAYIEVTEQGTEAAAATELDVVSVSMQGERVTFIANRPFLFYVRAGGEQLFAGIFTNQ